MRKSFERLFHFLASKQVALVLFPLLCLSLLPGTFEKEHFHLSGLSRILIGCLGLNLLCCTVQRWKNLSKPVLVMHVGVLLTGTGAMMSALGFVATVNIFEGTAADTVFRWDLNKDVSLGVSLFVKKIDIEYHPVPIKIGVLQGGQKAGLFVLKTGSSFTINQYTVRADGFIANTEAVTLSIFQGGRFIGSADTNGAAVLPADFPYSFKLVAFRDPVLKNVGVDLKLLRGSQVIQEGIIGANNPMAWNGLNFYSTSLDQDEYGNVYTGIQIVKDPGTPLVYLGFLAIMGGLLKWTYGRFYEYRLQ